MLQMSIPWKAGPATVMVSMLMDRAEQLWPGMNIVVRSERYGDVAGLVIRRGGNRVVIYLNDEKCFSSI